MFKVLCLFLMSLLCFSSFAGNRVVMLVSLDPETNRPPLRFRSWDINEKLEKVFKRKLKKENLELVIVPFVRQTELRRELLNPENHAVFWVGHSNHADSLAASGVYDDRGFNLKEIFQEVHQNIKFLGLVGCRALPFINGLKESSHWKNNKHLATYAREKKTDARKGLKRAIKAFLKMEPKEAATCEKEEVLSIKVRRSSDARLSAARILRKGELIGTFAEDQDEITIHLPAGLKRHEYKLTFESGAPNNVNADSFNLGLLEFESENTDLTWKLFADRDGNPLGFGAHVYRFTGKLTNELITENRLPKQCIK